MKYTLHDPCIITSRLLPGVKVGGVEISIEADYRDWEGRVVYHYYLDGPVSYENDDLRSGAGNGDLNSGLSSLLSFIAACGESYSYLESTGREGEHVDMFPKEIAQWASEHYEELGLLSNEIEENSSINESIEKRRVE